MSVLLCIIIILLETADSQYLPASPFFRGLKMVGGGKESSKLLKKQYKLLKFRHN